MKQGRKGQFELLGLLIEVGLLILGLFTIQSFIRDFWRPHEQIASANIAALQQVIDSVCAGGGSQELDFNLPQPTPLTVAGGLQNVVPKIFIKANGEPHFIVYYEAFPPGEGITWEAYHDLPLRHLIYFGGEVPTTDDIRNVIEVLKQRGFIGPIVFPNIILTNNDGLPGSIGNWSADGTLYKFANPAFATAIDKTSVKYRACGENALCYKTRNDIRKLSLPHCQGIKAMLVRREPPAHLAETVASYFTTWRVVLLTNPIGASAAALDILNEISATFIEGGIVNKDYVSNFYLASPCKAKVTVTKQECNCRNVVEVAGLDLDLLTKEYTSRYDLYSVDEKALTNKGERVLCSNQIPEAPAAEFEEECIQLELSGVDGFCTGGQNELGQVTLSTRWIDLGKGIVNLLETKPIREASSTLGGASLPWGWPG